MGNTPLGLSVHIAEDKYPLCSHNVGVTLVKTELVRIFIQHFSSCNNSARLWLYNLDKPEDAFFRSWFRYNFM